MTKKLTEDLKKAKIKTKEMTNFNENYFVAADAWPVSSNALTDRKNNNCGKAGVKLDFTILDIHVHHYSSTKELIFKLLLDT